MKTLKKSSDFLNIRNNGKKVYIGQWAILNFLSNGLSESRVGWTIPGKVANAVVRNKLKRWCRLCFKNTKHPKGYDFNIVFKATKTSDFYKTLSYKEFCDAVEYAVCRVNKKPAQAKA